MTQNDRVLSMLQEGPQTTASFLAARIPRFSARLRELREQGYNITSQRQREGSWRFELLGAQTEGSPPCCSPVASQKNLGWIADYRGPKPVHINPPREAA